MSLALGRYTFGDPGSLRGLPAISAVYAILKPHPLIGWSWPEVIYIGETANLAERGFPHGHHAYWRWVAEAGGDQNLGIAVLPVPWFHALWRKTIERELIALYDPPCNRKVG